MDTNTGSGPGPDPDLWPYNANTGIIDRALARSIRTWALTDGGMSETELRSLSQRQALHLYIDEGMKPILAKVLKQQRTPEEAEAAAHRVLNPSTPPEDGAERLLWGALQETATASAASAANRGNSANRRGAKAHRHG